MTKSKMCLKLERSQILFSNDLATLDTCMLSAVCILTDRAPVVFSKHEDCKNFSFTIFKQLLV